jgi:hypothetical protein
MASRAPRASAGSSWPGGPEEDMATKRREKVNRTSDDASQNIAEIANLPGALALFAALSEAGVEFLRILASF